MVFPSLLTLAIVATSEWDDDGDSKSVVAMTILAPTGQVTESMTEICDSPGCAVALRLVHDCWGLRIPGC